MQPTNTYAKFEDLVEKLLVGVYIIRKGRFMYVNPRFAEMFGYTQQELLDAGSYNLIIAEEDRALVASNAEKRLEGNMENIQYEVMGIKKDGTILHIEIFGSYTEFEGRRSLIGTIIDNTKKRAAEELLIKEKDLSRSLINQLPGIFYIFDNTGKHLLWNKNFETISGYTEEEIASRGAGTITTAKDLPVLQEKIIEVFTKGSSEVEAALLCKDGRELFYFYNGVTVTYDNKPCILGIGLDLSERRKAEIEREEALESLRKSEANLNTIFDNTDTVYTLLDENFRVIAYNQRAADFCEKEFRKKVGLHKNYIDYFPEEKHAALIDNMNKVLQGNHISYEVSYPQQDCTMNWYYVRMFPIANKEKVVYGIMTAVTDITEKKLMEEELLNRKVQEQKTTTRAILLGEERERNKIGQELHDNINQILAGTKMFLSLAKKAKEGKEDIINQSMEFIDNAINEIRVLSREKVTPLKKINLPELLHTLTDRFQGATGIRTMLDYQGADQTIEDDLKLNIYRIIQEQLNNILKHAEAKVILVNVQADKHDIHVVVSDDGKGFDVDEKKNGIGIANMINRVETFNGTIEIKSSPGNGCKIEIRLPYNKRVVRSH